MSVGQHRVGLADDEVHVWYSNLDIDRAEVERIRGILSEDELERAGRYYRTRDHVRFVAARGILRAILSEYTGRRPDELRFHYGRGSKPCLVPESGERRISFNLSHCGSIMVCGVTFAEGIGIDVETVRSIEDYEAVARNLFSHAEFRLLLDAPEGRSLAFLSCWTRKEAYSKATGDGLAIPLWSVDVSGGGEEWMPVGLTGVERLPEAIRWWMRDLPLPKGHVGAVVTSRAQARLICREWSDPRA